jgi:uncharacterized iron-regulated protein
MLNRLLILVALGLAVGCAALPRRELSASVLSESMQRQPIVLLGEVHDNTIQHEVRAQALAKLLESGRRPALAFEQFSRGRQSSIDELRRGPRPSDDALVDRLVPLGDPGWDWPLYRPFLKLAVRYDLPIVAAGLSREDAMRVAKEGFAAVFDEPTRQRLGLDRVPQWLLVAQQQQVDQGHCHQLLGQMLPALAAAQIARDAALAEAIKPYLNSGVVLLTGNGHARRDIGVPYFIAMNGPAHLISIGLLEDGGPDDEPVHGAYDEIFLTPVQARPDPCEALKRLKSTPPKSSA